MKTGGDCPDAPLRPFVWPQMPKEHFTGEDMKHIKLKMKAGPTFEDIKGKLPKNYVHKPNTVILMDQNDNPVLKDNGDGTVSGLPVDIFIAR